MQKKNAKSEGSFHHQEFLPSHVVLEGSHGGAQATQASHIPCALGGPTPPGPGTPLGLDGPALAQPSSGWVTCLSLFRAG